MLDYIFNRSEYNPTKERIKYFENKTILITGTAGSIGSALTKVLSNFPYNLIIFNRSEFTLFKLKQGFINNSKIHFYLGNITDEHIVQHLFESIQPNIGYHIAAYKHVALTQEHLYLVFKTNSFATNYKTKHTALNKTEHCVLVSTDKTVNSINLLGQPKFLEEEIFKNYNTINLKNNYKIIRFGNIPYSTGSLLPLFESQLTKNKKIEIRHKKVARYFINLKDV